MNTLLFSLTDEATGNATTAARIIGHLQSAGHNVIHLSSAVPWTAKELHAIEQKEQIDLAIGIHAYGAGKHLLHLSVPRIVVFGGTDLNEMAKDTAIFAVMTKVVLGAFALVVFDNDFFTKACELWPEISFKLHLVPQATMVSPSSFSLREKLSLRKEDKLFLLPAGLRPVKDPMFCAQAFSNWHAEDPSVQMVIVGAVRDPLFAKNIEDIVKTLPGVVLHSAIAQSDLHAAMREANAVLNTSLSESSPNTVLEAMALGTPVLVRDIPGNRSIVSQRDTGLLFTTPTECCALGAELLQNIRMRESLVHNAQLVINDRHGVEAERKAYFFIFFQLRKSQESPLISN